MKTLDELGRLVTGIAIEQWEIDEVKASFIPWSADYRFDLSSDFCTRLARKLRQSPEYIVEQIIKLAEKKTDFSFTGNCGFLCYRGPVDRLWLGQEMRLGESPPHHSYLLLLPPATVQCCGWGYLRLTSQALFQAISLRSQGCAVTICVAGVFRQQLKTDRDLHNVMKSFLGIAGHSEKINAMALLALLQSQIELNDEQGKYLWLTSDSLPPKLFRRLVNTDNLCCLCAEKNWMKGITQPLVPQRYIDLDNSRLLPVFICLAGNQVASDLVPEMAQFDGTDNLLWFAETIQRRVNTILDGKTGMLIDWNQGNVGEYDRNLAIRFKFLRCNWELAGIKGLVRHFWIAFADTLTLTTRLCNDPGFRQRLHFSEQTGPRGEILSGGMDVLSDIITRVKCIV